MDNRVVVDPLKLTDETNQLLFKYLMRWLRNGRTIAANKTHFYKLTRFTLTHDLVLREKVPGVWRVDVVSSENCGETRTGFLYPVMAVISISDNSSKPLIVEEKNKRIYLSQNKDGAAEFSLMQRCPHLRARGLFAHIPSMISIQKPRGERLIDILNKDRRAPFLTIDDRYQMSIALLRALKIQIHGFGICKKEIVPDTVFYDSVSGEFTFYELDKAKLENDQSDLRARGNAVFSSPEEFTSTRTGIPVTKREFDAYVGMKSMTNSKSDIFSISRVIGLIWHDVDPLFTGTQDRNQHMYRRIQYGWQAQFNLFHRLPDLSDSEKSEIESLLRWMAKLNSDGRPNIDECIRQFQNIYLNHQLKDSPQEYIAPIKVVHAIAQNLADVLNSVNDADIYIKQFEMALNDIPDDELSLKYFIVAFGEKYLFGITSVEELRVKIKDIFALFNESHQFLIRYRDKFTSSCDQIKLKELNHFLKGINAEKISLDSMVNNIDRMKLKIAKLNPDGLCETQHEKKGPIH